MTMTIEKLACFTAEDFSRLTREAAVAILVDLDVERWGEAERGAAARMHASLTRGLAINALHNRLVLAGYSAEGADRVADDALTAADWAQLHEGG